MKAIFLYALCAGLLALSSCTVYQNKKLEEAIVNNDYAGAKKALASGADPNTASSYKAGHSLTSYAAYKGHNNIASLLVSKGGKSRSKNLGNTQKIREDIAAEKQRVANAKAAKERAERKAAQRLEEASKCKWCNKRGEVYRHAPFGFSSLGLGYFCSQKCVGEYQDHLNRNY